MAKHDFYKNHFDSGRRSFFKYSLLAIGGVALSPYFWVKNAFADALLPFSKESNPTATAFGYFALAAKWIKRNGPRRQVRMALPKSLEPRRNCILAKNLSSTVKDGIEAPPDVCRCVII